MAGWPEQLEQATHRDSSCQAGRGPGPHHPGLHPAASRSDNRLPTRHFRLVRSILADGHVTAARTRRVPYHRPPAGQRLSCAALTAGQC
ncbi:hypothetical protein RRG08_010172 [Elysia crispata]|uniref:Uncharacterized protein n=1 Tax=Elysia crispata TaxID=231223 RepID=A0AAE1E112_9GAST|nr:hypothetical protein RRG08_010172 [Elysia crispata]